MTVLAIWYRTLIIRTTRFAGSTQVNSLHVRRRLVESIFHRTLRSIAIYVHICGPFLHAVSMPNKIRIPVSRTQIRSAIYDTTGEIKWLRMWIVQSSKDFCTKQFLIGMNQLRMFFCCSKQLQYACNAWEWNVKCEMWWYLEWQRLSLYSDSDSRMTAISYFVHYFNRSDWHDALHLRRSLQLLTNRKFSDDRSESRHQQTVVGKWFLLKQCNGYSD